MSDNSNIWYLDRGKNFFTEEGKELFNTIINVVNTYSYLEKMTSSELIEKFPQKMKKSGNPNALLTTSRNIGIINKENKLGKNIQYYLNDQLTYKELIFENLTKVNYDKNKNEGLSVTINHRDGWYTIYMHLSKINVKEGQEVSKEQKIGGMGCTGSCTGTHLHLGVYKGEPYRGGQVVDPCNKEVYGC